MSRKIENFVRGQALFFNIQGYLIYQCAVGDTTCICFLGRPSVIEIGLLCKYIG